METNRTEGMTPTEIAALIKKVKRMDLRVDVEWSELHKWANDYVTTKKISKRHFVERILGFPSWYTQYLTPGGLKDPPSNRIGSYGQRFREAVRKMKQEETDSQVPVNESQILLDVVREYFDGPWLGKVQTVSNVSIDGNHINLSIYFYRKHVKDSEEAVKTNLKTDLGQYLLEFFGEKYDVHVKDLILVDEISSEMYPH
jgi:hypothetical protein